MRDDQGECETCSGLGYLIGDTADSNGERTDIEVPCPECTREHPDYDTREEREQDYRFAFDYGADERGAA